MDVDQNESFQCFQTEKVLPSVILVEECNCPLCGRLKKFYSCRRCSERGSLVFLVQQPNDDEESSEKVFPGFISGITRRKVDRLQQQLKTTEEINLKALEASAALDKKEKLLVSIIETKKRIEILKRVRDLQLGAMRRLQKEAKICQSNIEQFQRRSQRVQMKKTKITEYMTTKQSVVEKTKETLASEREHLLQVHKKQVSDLITHIFPIVGLSQEEVFERGEKLVNQNVDQEVEIDEVEEALAEARRLSFVHGRWIYDQGEGPDMVRLSICSSRASAPADGDYSSCVTWLKSLFVASSGPIALEASEPSTSMTDHVEPHRSPGASIYAALSHATQLTHTLRKLLCIHLPYKHYYKQFSNPNMTVQDFLWNVRRLNGNVLVLCLLYGVEPRLIHPLHTLPNLQNAVQSFLHNGDRILPSNLSPDLVTSIEEALNDSSDPLPDDDDYKMEDLMSEWEDSLNEEDWESLAPKPLSDQEQPQYTSAAPFQSQVQTDDLGTSQGLMSSAVAWVTKGWWNR